MDLKGMVTIASLSNLAEIMRVQLLKFASSKIVNVRKDLLKVALYVWSKILILLEVEEEVCFKYKVLKIYVGKYWDESPTPP